MIKHLSTQVVDVFAEKHTDADASTNTIFSRNALVDPQRANGQGSIAMVVGGPGSGKDFNVLLPNLLQMSGSYFVIDPSGVLYRKTADMFKDNGYAVKTLNLIHPEKSTHYDPLNYVKSDGDVTALIRCFMNTTKGTSCNGTDPFWEQSEAALLTALASYCINHQDAERRRFAMMSELLHEAKTDPEATMNKLDALFNEVRASEEYAACVKQYGLFKQASENTAKAILVSAAARFAPFHVEAVRNLISADQMELASACEIPTVIYVIVPCGDNPYAFLMHMLVSQMLDVVYHHEQTEHHDEKQRYHMHMLLNEFANLGLMPDLSRKLIAIKNCNCSCMLFIQAIPQLKNLYGDNYVTLMDACDVLVYLGGNEVCTITELPQIVCSMCDTEIDVEDLRTMHDHNCMVCVRDFGAFVDDKYPAKDHPNFDKVNNP